MCRRALTQSRRGTSVSARRIRRSPSAPTNRNPSRSLSNPTNLAERSRERDQRPSRSVGPHLRRVCAVWVDVHHPTEDLGNPASILCVASVLCCDRTCWAEFLPIDVLFFAWWQTKIHVLVPPRDA